MCHSSLLVSHPHFQNLRSSLAIEYCTSCHPAWWRSSCWSVTRYAGAPPSNFNPAAWTLLALFSSSVACCGDDWGSHCLLSKVFLWSSTLADNFVQSPFSFPLVAHVRFRFALSCYQCYGSFICYFNFVLQVHGALRFSSHTVFFCDRHLGLADGPDGEPLAGQSPLGVSHWPPPSGLRPRVSAVILFDCQPFPPKPTIPITLLLEVALRR